MEEVQRLKEEANLSIRKKDAPAAIQRYTQAIRICRRLHDASQKGQPSPACENVDLSNQLAESETGESARDVLGQLFSNRAYAYLQTKSTAAARDDALESTRLLANWAKPWYRLALAHLGLQQFSEAFSACNHGSKLVEKNDEAAARVVEFEDLLSKIRLHALLRNERVGLSGRVLEVRDAGENAWLGLPAPDEKEPSDVPQLPSTSLPCGAIEYGGISAASASCSPSQRETVRSTALLAVNCNALNPVFHRLTFKCIHDALDESLDGDEIVLREGVHNGLGKAVNVDKRVLIRGIGRLGCTKIDQRANSPTFRITASATILNIDLDMTGFRECILVDGDSTCQPIIHNCILKCSGDDGVNLSGECKPTFHKCSIEARKSGIKTFDSSKGVFLGCMISECGGPGLRGMSDSNTKLEGCTIQKNKEDGLVAMDR
ncbi:hypothetical protein BSKO_13430 [Bryopsis sp. KO-2023]|nr:hypothetical protein BSKO_13430 [Bryopsis sp. KO-2023]